MEFTLIYFACALTIIIYSLISGSLLSKPWKLIGIGFLVCSIAATLKVTTEAINSALHISSNISSKIDLEVFSTTLAALGGGLISGGFLIKAQIAHKERIAFLRNKLASLEKKAAKYASPGNDEEAADQTAKYIINSLEQEHVVEEIEKTDIV